jgi:hypothetical protein
MKMSFFFSRAKARPITVLSLPLMRSQQPSDGLFSPMEVRTNHLPMCTGPLGTCPSGMVLHIKNFALHGLISPRDHSNVNHISSLILSNACIKPLAYHLIAQRHYNDLLYKAEEKDKMPYWASIHKKRKVPKGYHPSHVTRGGVVKGCPDIVEDRGDIIRGCLCRRRVVPVMDAILSKPFIAFILSFLYYFFFLLFQGLTRGHCLGVVTRADSVTHEYFHRDDKAGS